METVSSGGTGETEPIILIYNSSHTHTHTYRGNCTAKGESEAPKGTWLWQRQQHTRGYSQLRAGAQRG